MVGAIAVNFSFTASFDFPGVLGSTQQSFEITAGNMRSIITK